MISLEDINKAQVAANTEFRKLVMAMLAGSANAPNKLAVATEKITKLKNLQARAPNNVKASLVGRRASRTQVLTAALSRARKYLERKIVQAHANKNFQKGFNQTAPVVNHLTRGNALISEAAAAEAANAAKAAQNAAKAAQNAAKANAVLKEIIGGNWSQSNESTRNGLVANYIQKRGRVKKFMNRRSTYKNTMNLKSFFGAVDAKTAANAKAAAEKKAAVNAAAKNAAAVKKAAATKAAQNASAAKNLQKKKAAKNAATKAYTSAQNTATKARSAANATPENARLKAKANAANAAANKAKAVVNAANKALTAAEASIPPAP